ncbi:glycosyltransferase family 2 protein [Helicobacter sp. MIT 99-5507]|uniref:glycosyltransferase family 2 protein n=1 Tax=Helicobacter sp. MIT 99-5507 TaxID=152489 RepID=UPI000E1F39D8|nr:glycosyltransferase family 2 protein [Helicobacter sp. MIT 99-5507]RDU56724.1 glycosyl transferase [Helicobacter sp. MIT 99-5507]
MKFAFLIPFYNHPESIEKLVDYISKYKIDIIIVDDGSNADSKIVLNNLKDVKILTRKHNGGKGAAIKSGLNLAKDLMYSHIFQIDADMQHELSKIDDFITLSKSNPNSLICANPIYGKDAPKSRLYGRKITNFWVYINTLGGNLKDTMCGMRIYPLYLIYPLLKECKSNRMDFDIDILILAYKNMIDFKWIDVRIKYDSDGVSHFKALRDNILISKMHARHFFGLPKFIFNKYIKE